MPAGAIIALVIVIIVIVAAAALAGALLVRRLSLRRQFGPEYQRLAREVGTRRAHAELADRQRRVARLTLRPLSAERHAIYTGEWTAAQERFVDSPAEATEAAAALVTTVAADRGYKVGDHTQLVKDLSVHHPRQLDGYRQAAQTTEQAASAATEDLRQALLAHRALFRELLGSPERADARPLAAPGTIVPGSVGRALPVGASSSGAGAGEAAASGIRGSRSAAAVKTTRR
jgi:hypothetical protein